MSRTKKKYNTIQWAELNNRTTFFKKFHGNDDGDDEIGDDDGFS